MMSDEMKDVCYGCGKVDVYGSMRDVKDIEFDILCDACWTEKEKEFKELYESATNEIATLKDEAKALDRKLTDMVLDLGWDCQRMSQGGLATYNAICRALNIEEYKEEYEEAT